MGLLDVLNGMQQGPRGPSTPGPKSEGGGMSSMTMALLGLLAWKAVKHLTAAPAGGTPGPAKSPAGGGSVAGKPQASPAAIPASAQNGGGLAGTLGGLLAGGAAGSVISGGLGDLLKQLQQGGQGDAANSWVGSGENKPVTPKDLASALGADQIDQLSAHTGLSRDDLLSGLSQYLPKMIDHLTPEGRLPSEGEVARRI
jgi:uncharacterized protein YidB (DUF937 family)